MLTTDERLVIDATETAHLIEGSDRIDFSLLTDEQRRFLELSEVYDDAKIQAIRETYNSRFARSRNIFRTSKLSNFSERTKAKGKKMAFRTGTSFVLNYSADALSLVPVTVPGAIVASAAAGAMGTGYDSFVNKHTSHKLWGYSATQDFLTSKETLQPERLRGKKREYRDLIDRLNGDEYISAEDVKGDIEQVGKLIRVVEDGMIYNARSGVEIRVTNDKTAENKGWVEVDGLESGLSFLYEKKRMLAKRLLDFEADIDSVSEVFEGLLPKDVTKSAERLIEEVVEDRINSLKSRIKKRQTAMWVSETVASTAVSLTGGILVGKWAERTFGWGKEVAEATKSSLNQYFEFHKDLFLADPVKFKGTLSSVADTHIADQLDRVLMAEIETLSEADMSLREFADFQGISQGSEFREIFEQEYLNNADAESIGSFVEKAGDADLDSPDGALEFVQAAGMDRYALDPQTKTSLNEIFVEKEIVSGTDLTALMKRNPRVFGDLESRYIGEVKYFDAVSRMPKEDFDKYALSLQSIDSNKYTADEAVLKLQMLANEVGVSYEEKIVRVPVVENYQVVSGDTVYGILDRNGIALDSPESAKFVTDNREVLRVAAMQFGNEKELDILLAKIDSGEIDSLGDDYALSGSALHWINTGDKFSITTGYEDRLERVTIGQQPEWLKPVGAVDLQPDLGEARLGQENILTAERIIDLRKTHIPDRVEIPSIGLNADVNEVASLNNVDYPYISRGFAGHMAETGSLGYEDWPNKNMIIGGHVSYQGNPAVFYDLDKVNIGEIIKVTDVSGREVIYRVRSLDVVHESEIGSKVPLNSDKDILTLITCEYNRNENKIVVVADRWDPSLQTQNEDKIAMIKREIASIKQVMDFGSSPDKSPNRVTGIDELRRFKEALLAKVA